MNRREARHDRLPRAAAALLGALAILLAIALGAVFLPGCDPGEAEGPDGGADASPALQLAPGSRVPGPAFTSAADGGVG